MEAFVSLWSADLLALGEEVRRVEDRAAGFHIDVFDGHNVPELLFGPDLVEALRAFTAARIEVHLNVTDPGYWAGRFAAAGADIITVQSGPCDDVAAVLAQIRALGCEPGLGIELHEPASSAATFFGLATRLLLLGTPIGVRGRQLDPAAPARVADLVRLRERSPHHPTIAVDGGVRRHTVPLLAAAGADGVIPGSLVYGADDPAAVLGEIAALAPGSGPGATSAFWSTGARA
ncbi:MAG: ribulose-phosphate 3-epimerase [Streptosporangiaceae bacterium]|jgi:ribulose-phosphate 3-epimerase|nr:ribulose-phosphate 3-epimerase [Streptosporangiaceae bacterium]